jgi:hypothetical protein
MPVKMLNPNTKIVLVPEDSIVNPLAPTADELNNAPAIDISCAVTRGYTLNPTDSDTDDTASICDTGNVQTRLFDNYEGELTMFRDANSADATSVYNVAFTFLKQPDVRFWAYRRLGKKSTVPFVDGDLVEGFLFANDRIRSVDGGDSGPIQFTAPLLSQGNYTGFTYVGIVVAPTVTAVSPTTAALTGGSAHTITGTGFGSVYKVEVGGTVVNATVQNGTTITFIAPAHAAGTADVVVTNGAGYSATNAESVITYS